MAGPHLIFHGPILAFSHTELRKVTEHGWPGPDMIIGTVGAGGNFVYGSLPQQCP